MRLGLAVVCAGLCAPAAVARAEPRPIEVGGFVGADFFPKDVELGNSWAPDQVPGPGPTVGGRAAWWLLPDLVSRGAITLDLGVEGEAQVTMSSTSSDAMAGRSSYASPVLGLGGHLILALETGTPVMPHVVVGGGANAMFTSSPFARDDLDPVGYWGLGASWRMSDRLALRVDLRQGIEAGRMSDITSTFQAEVGIATIFGHSATAHPSLDSYMTDSGPPPPPHHDVVVTPPLPPPPADKDGDGILDADDKCPTAAEDKDGFNDDDGCPDPDNDGDGIADAADKCPNEPEVYNGIGDDDGCPDTVPPELAAILGTAKGVTFDNAKPHLKPAAKKALDAVAAILRKFPTVRLRVDGRAGKGVKDDLARRRAEAVKWYLIDAGIAADRIDTDGVPADAGPARIELQIVTPAAATP